MGERLDPEAVRELMQSYFHRMRGAIESYGGTVEKFVGDAVMAVFGVPEAHEDDPVRACRAAFEMQLRLPELNRELEHRYGASLALRIGVNSGEVVTGDPATRETFVAGDAVNTAARLEQAAKPGEVLLGPLTYSLVKGTLQAEAVAPLQAKGKAEPVAAYRLVSVPLSHEPRRRLQTLLVGRIQELAALNGIYEDALNKRNARRALVIGEPGVGKSRLAEEFTVTVAADARVITGRCLPYGEGITYWPLAEIVRSAAGIRDEHDRLEAQARIRRLVTNDLIADPLAQTLGLREGVATAGEIAWAARRLAEMLAAERPLILVVDDLQWAEEALLELLERLAERGRGRILLLCLARPELLDQNPNWKPTIALEPLDSVEAAELAQRLVPAANGARDRVVAAAGGNPLFLEELSMMLIEDPRAMVDIPPTLEGLLAARLDAVPEPERQTAERASIEGQVFHRGAVLALSNPPSPEEVRTALAALEERALVLPAPADFVDEAAFRFRHLLLRDAAYRGLSKRLRSDLHERFAGWLESKARDRLSEVEEILGHHLEQAYRYRVELGPLDDPARSLALRAGKHLASAGRRARARADTPAAVNLLGRAVELLRRVERDIELELDLAEALLVSGRLAEAETLAAEAAAEAAKAGDRRKELHARLAGASIALTTDPERAIAELLPLAEEAKPVFEEAGDEAGLMKAWYAVCDVEQIKCQFGARNHALERALVHAQSSRDEYWTEFIRMRLATGYYGGPTPVEESLRWHATQRSLERKRPLVMEIRAGYEAMRGRFDLARSLYNQALDHAAELGDQLALANSGQPGYLIETLAGDAVAAERHVRRACELLQEMGERGWLASNAGILARALVALERFDEAEEWSHRAEEMSSIDDVDAQVRWRRARAVVFGRRRQFVEAERLARVAVALIGQTDMTNDYGDALMDLAEVLELASKHAEAVDAIEQAIGLYERKGNVVMSERARSSLAELG
jgi:class 3 adenylate cyclase/tetratricopeptide (TPR) repeat protein